MVGYLEFREKLLPEGCFSIHQARAFFPSFDRNNLTRWSHKDLLIKLRQGWYAFPELLQRPDFARYVACRIYRPSYISLHTALSIYGMIPEAVTSITSISTLKTARFENKFGQYSYQLTWLLAQPEKALLDLLYLYPFYDNDTELEQLRLDEAYMTEELDIERLKEYQQKISNKALDSRVKKLLRIYDL